MQAMPFFRKQDWEKNYEEARSVCPLEEKNNQLFHYFQVLAICQQDGIVMLNTEDLQ